MPKLSIIVPVYNAERFIRKCIASILAQSFKDFELILVNDGSTDSCGAICDEYVSKDKRIKVIHQANQGVSVARNNGIKYATGTLVGFVDADDYIAPDMFEGIVNFLEANDLDVVCADCYVVKNGKLKFKPRYDKDIIWNHGNAIVEILSGTLDNAVWNKVYKKEVIAGIYFPAQRRYEDVATTYKFIFNAKRVGYMSKPYYFYVKHKGNFISQSFNVKSRYEHFLGYKERLEFAMHNNITCIDSCRKIVLESALSALTAFYANGVKVDDVMFKEVATFIEDNMGMLKGCKLRRKHRVLIWSFNNCRAIHKLYALLSKFSKVF